MRESLVSHNYDKFDKLDENTQNFLIKLAELVGAWMALLITMGSNP